MRKIQFEENEYLVMAMFEESNRLSTMEKIEEVVPFVEDDPEIYPLVMTTIEKMKCISDDDFKKIQRILVEKNFSQLKIVDKNQTQEISNNRWWIYIPPFASRQDAENRARELLQGTITEYFIIKDGKFKNAISLGIFSQEKTATDFLKTLQQRNVNEAKMLIRENKKVIKNVAISDFISEQQFKRFIEILRKNKVNLNFLSNTDFSKC